jgi:hypothetical protein
MSETANTNTFDIEALPIDIRYVGQTKRDNDWDCDEWHITFKNKDGHWTTPYYTGLGLRTPIPQLYLRMNPPRRGTLAYAQLEKATRKPITPKKADILYSLFMDASAAEYNFDDWCDSYGYSNDSIKALNTYKECLETAQRLRRYFTAEQRAVIQEAIENM